MREENGESIPIALLGASGYAGQVLHALLLHHPRMRPVIVEAREPDGATIAICRDVAAAALALPDDVALRLSDALADQGVKIIDLSSAQRTRDAIHTRACASIGVAIVQPGSGCAPASLYSAGAGITGGR